MLVLSLDEISEELNIPKSFFKLEKLSAFVVQLKTKTYYSFEPNLVKVICEDYLKRTKYWDMYDFLNRKYQNIQIKKDKYFSFKKIKTNRKILNLYKPTLQEKIDRELKNNSSRTDGYNVTLSEPEKWTQSALDCLNNKGFCSICNIKKIMESRCVMKYSVRKLLKKLGKPNNCKISDREIETSFMFLGN